MKPPESTSVEPFSCLNVTRVVVFKLIAHCSLTRHVIIAPVCWIVVNVGYIRPKVEGCPC